MQYNDNSHNISTFLRDYGVPIVFEAGVEQGFSVGDTIVFVFNDERLQPKVFYVSNEDFTFEFKLTKAEAESIFENTESYFIIPYSVKRYRSDRFLETLFNAKIEFRSTIKWQN